MCLSLKQFQPTAVEGQLLNIESAGAEKVIFKNAVAESSRNSKFCPTMDFIGDFCRLMVSFTHQKE